MSELSAHVGPPVRHRRAAAAGLVLGVTLIGSVTVAAPATAGRPQSRATSCVAKIDPAALHARGRADVVVIGRPGGGAAAGAAVRAAGGRVIAALPIVDGVRASVPVPHLRRLGCSADVRAVTPNSAIKFQSRPQSDTSTGTDFLKETGASTGALRGASGKGVGVAVIDTGVSPMADVAGRVVYGPDLSGEGSYLDSYGHGTVMAGIIGGNGSAGHAADGSDHAGVAPDAMLVSVKVAGRNGAADVSTVLAAMHWVAAYRSEFNIRVLNLSWGTPSTQSPTIDPLDYAVERLWQLGIVVVVAAGNTGDQPGSVLKPADDPLVITAGAYADAKHSGPSKYAVPEWSSTGPTAAGYAKPDVVAPGRTLIALRAYGSQVESDNPDALVAPSYIKGSGTSEAAAVTSGAIAALLSARPNLTPDQVKHILMSTAKSIPGTPASRQGSGRLSLDGALHLPAGAATTQTPIATGLGSLEASRGGRHVQTDCNNDGTVVVIEGETDVRCQQWDGASWTGGSWTGASWTGGSWTGASWTGGSWTGASWTGGSWTGGSWTGGSWTGGSWTGESWFGASWTGGSWTGGSWTGGSWTGASWTGASWTGASWTSDSWSSHTSFLTAWWGDEPAAGMHIAGEASG